MKLHRLFTAALVVLAALSPATAFVAPSAHEGIKDFIITNNSGAARSDLHLEITWTGGTARLVVVTNAPGCAAPVVTNPGTPFTITWPAACVDPGESIRIGVTGEFIANAEIASGYWTPGTPGQFPLAPGDIQAVSEVPGASTGALVALLIALALAGVWMLKRRTAAAA